MLAGCASDDGGPTELTWYINPDNGGQATIAEQCSADSGGKYTITTSLLTAPFGATLAHRTDPRRLKRIFAAFLMIVALNMLRKALL